MDVGEIWKLGTGSAQIQVKWGPRAEIRNTTSFSNQETIMHRKTYFLQRDLAGYMNYM